LSTGRELTEEDLRKVGRVAFGLGYPGETGVTRPSTPTTPTTLTAEPDAPLPRLNPQEAESIYLDNYVELTVQALSFRTMNQILLGQLRDLHKQLDNCQRSLRELQARYRERVRRDAHR
jgi:hypothetical protein